MKKICRLLFLPLAVMVALATSLCPHEALAIGYDGVLQTASGYFSYTMDCLGSYKMSGVDTHISSSDYCSSLTIKGSGGGNITMHKDSIFIVQVVGSGSFYIEPGVSNIANADTTFNVENVATNDGFRAWNIYIRSNTEGQGFIYTPVKIRTSADAYIRPVAYVQFRASESSNASINSYLQNISNNTSTTNTKLTDLLGDISDIKSILNSFGSDTSDIKDGVNDLNDKQEQAREEVEDAQQETETQGQSSQQQASGDGQTLLGAFTSFIGAITSASPSNCNINMDTGYIDFGIVNLCSLTPPPAFQAISSIVVIGFAVPLSLAAARKMIELFRSFQS